MLSAVSRIWHRLFLQERPAISLGMFRIAVAVTVGTHVIPSLIPMADNYLGTAFKEKNFSFFPVWFIQWVEKSPDDLVWIMAGLFYLFWFLFLIGLWSQASCILMTLCCYYFYALSSLHIGMLSWDILLVTLFLMAITNYHGDYFSLDAVFRNKRGKPAPLRPFFIQRLLQFQIAWIYFYTALCKIYPGNWYEQNVYYFLINTPPGGVVKDFWMRGYLADSPEFCLLIQKAVMIAEFAIPFLLFIPILRYAAIAAGITFHFLLLFTLHVPTIFFFLFPPQFLLFLKPETLLECLTSKKGGL